MTRKIIKPVCTLTLAVLLLMTARSQLYAIDSSSRYFAYGVGQRSCEDYIKFRERRLESLERDFERYSKDELYEIVNWIVEHWIAGFLTAHNLYVSDTYDLVGKLTMGDLKLRLERSCRTNSKQYFAEAVLTLAQELHPQRVKAAGGK